MALDPTAPGRSLPSVERTWTSTDVLLYAVGVGAGPNELYYTTENSAGITLQAIPTYATVLGESFTRELVELAGDVDWTRAVDGAHALEIHRPLPVEGKVRTERRIVAVYDKGSAGVVVTETCSFDYETGHPMFTNRTSMFFPEHGGFGGDRGPSATWQRPPRPPDHVIVYETRPETPLVYRLTGDRYPLHSDPTYAHAAGFPEPILHGLCTFGYTTRALIAAVSDGEPALLRSIDARFTAPGFPGDRLSVEIWCDGDSAFFVTKRTDGTVILDQGTAKFGEPGSG